MSQEPLRYAEALHETGTIATSRLLISGKAATPDTAALVNGTLMHARAQDDVAGRAHCCLVRARWRYLACVGTKSGGTCDPSPKKYFSHSLNMNSIPSLLRRSRRYSLTSIFECSIHMRHASFETLS